MGNVILSRYCSYGARRIKKTEPGFHKILIGYDIERRKHPASGIFFQPFNPKYQFKKQINFM